MAACVTGWMEVRIASVGFSLGGVNSTRIPALVSAGVQWFGGRMW